MAKVEREQSQSAREAYQWRGEETRDSGPCDKSYDPDEAQRRRDARSVPTPPKDSKQRK
jgi:hypothetical protein